MSTKNSDNTIGNRTRDLLARSVIPQPNAPPRTPVHIWRVLHFRIPTTCFGHVCQQMWLNGKGTGKTQYLWNNLKSTEISVVTAFVSGIHYLFSVLSLKRWLKMKLYILVICLNTVKRLTLPYRRTDTKSVTNPFRFWQRNNSIQSDSKETSRWQTQCKWNTSMELSCVLIRWANW